ncbi:MAG: gfo/Idh/MocA family oxidoreductase, partial [Clostridia bacterium]|nr:gfo/Idh/MocA family oxidoreductase [Clostridia bacterium]
TTVLEFPNGATGTFITTTGEWPGANRLEISMDKGKLLVENGKLFLYELEMMEQEFTATNTIPFNQPKYTVTEVETDGQNTQHCGVLNAFAGAILRGEELVASGTEGIHGLTLSNAMHLSAWTGREVELPFDDDLFYDLLMERVKTSRRKENVQTVISDLSATYNTNA